MISKIACTAFLGFISLSHAWISNPTVLKPSNLSTANEHVRVLTTVFAGEEDSLESSTLSSDTNPCWQDLYDDDCSMSTIYAASFIAKDWIKTLPCANGLEDCDMPEELKLPNSYQDGVESVDVMKMLGISRPDELKS